MSKHTQGPWEAIEGRDGNHYIHKTPHAGCPRVKPVRIAVVTREAKGAQKADANLIAAAPDLLAACEELRCTLEWCDDGNYRVRVGKAPEYQEALYKINDALKKARGDNPAKPCE
jgi:hypothetical protein